MRLVHKEEISKVRVTGGIIFYKSGIGIALIINRQFGNLS